ncbi:MAG: hypothetical protein JWM74_6270 [Myxococcaceae bacterium]|jgi:hypothetical protein|nr:hypothetical protein [Myxococcaceae bacterium]
MRFFEKTRRTMLRAAVPLAAFALTVVGGLAFARSAAAQDRSELLQSRRRTYESSQNFAFELRFAPYTPQIDDDPKLGGARPYEKSFGTAPRLELAAEFDWQMVNIPWVGSLGPGISIGTTSMTRPATKLDGTPSASEQSLDIYPMYLVAVLRADVFMRKMRIPLVPYAKLGLGYALWRAYTTGGTSEAPNGSGTIAGKGSTYGAHAALGLAFQMNSLDPGAGRAFDESLGVNNTYLYAEWMLSSLSNFGSASALRVGTSTWVAGLAFEF